MKNYGKKAEGHIRFGGGSGIRTHVGLPPNGFQDRPVMTTSVSLQVQPTRIKSVKQTICFTDSGDPSESRTPDTLIKSQVLYQLS